MTEQQQWTWQPIRKQVRLGTDEPTGNYLMLVDGDLVEYDYYGDELARYPLRDDTAFCRRVPAQGAGVPYPIRSVLDAALIVYITECRQVDDPDGETLAHQAQQWLDSQRPAPGQGGNDE